MLRYKLSKWVLRYKLADWISGGDLSAFDKLAAELHGELERSKDAHRSSGESADRVISTWRRNCEVLFAQRSHLERGLLNIINSTNGIKQGTAQKVNRQAKHILAHMPRGE